MQKKNTAIFIAVLIGILIGALIIVSFLRAPVNAGVLPNQFGPCSYFVQTQNAIVTVTAQIAIGGLIAGQQVSSTPSQDFRGFFQPFINNLQQVGGGNVCMGLGEYDVSTSQSCNMNGGGQTCGLLIRGNAIFFTGQGGYARENFGCTGCTNVQALTIKWTGTGTITCLVCYGQALSTIEWLGGGMTNIGVDGNGVTGFVNECIDAFDIQDFNFRNGFAVNCITDDILTAGSEPGGISNAHIDSSLFGMQAQDTTGNGVDFGAGTGQSWIQNNFFAAKVFGYAIIDNGGNSNPFGNKILGNHIEACGMGTGGLLKAGSCIFSLEQFDSIQFNTMFNGVDYDCIYGSAQGQLIQGNICEGGINQQNNSDGACFATDNGVAADPFTSIVENNCTGLGASNHMNYCVYVNGVAIAQTHNITINNNRCSGWAKSAIALTGTFDGGTMLVANNAGNWQPPIAVTAGASVWTYTNTDGYFETMKLFTVGGISAWTCRGVTGWSTVINNECYLQPGSTMTVTWATTAPVFQKVYVNP